MFINVLAIIGGICVASACVIGIIIGLNNIFNHNNTDLPEGIPIECTSDLVIGTGYFFKQRGMLDQRYCSNHIAATYSGQLSMLVTIDTSKADIVYMEERSLYSHLSVKDKFNDGGTYDVNQVYVIPIHKFIYNEHVSWAPNVNEIYPMERFVHHDIEAYRCDVVDNAIDFSTAVRVNNTVFTHFNTDGVPRVNPTEIYQRFFCCKHFIYS